MTPAMSTSELLEDDRAALKEALEAALPEDQMEPLRKKARALADEITDSIEWNLKDNLAANLSYHVREMAGRAVNALMEGNEAEMIRWLSCDQRGYTGRSDGYNTNRTIEQQHPVIHGKLFEQGCVKLRKMIVEAHRDLIAEQRILDLEDQVRSLVAQNNKLAREKEDLWQSVRGAA
jgi:hypothetical protein